MQRRSKQVTVVLDPLPTPTSAAWAKLAPDPVADAAREPQVKRRIVRIESDVHGESRSILGHSRDPPQAMSSARHRTSALPCASKPRTDAGLTPKKLAETRPHDLVLLRTKDQSFGDWTDVRRPWRPRHRDVRAHVIADSRSTNAGCRRKPRIPRRRPIRFLAFSLDATDDGLLVENVEAGSAAARAGIEDRRPRDGCRWRPRPRDCGSQDSPQRGTRTT